ncbi:MAG TPA: hypothetical protein VMT28_07655 [Terriglobales bacterium]|jgi:hypothetical protein|nr:hypothetical protein [Terriglobales bacterium]
MRTVSGTTRKLLRTAVNLCGVGLLLVVSGTAKEKNIGPGHDRWPVKTSADLSQTPKSVTISKLKNLPPLFTSESKASRDEHQNKVHSQVKGGLREGQLLSVQHGYLQLIAREASFNQTHNDFEDGDYHIQIGETRDEREGCVIVEIPDPQFVDDADLKAKVTQARADVMKILKLKSVSDSGTCIAHPPRVTVVGQLFWDSAHSGSDPGGGRGKKQCHQKAATLWEVHPVIAITAEPNPDAGKPALSCQ